MQNSSFFHFLILHLAHQQRGPASCLKPQGRTSSPPYDLSRLCNYSITGAHSAGVVEFEHAQGAEDHADGHHWPGTDGAPLPHGEEIEQAVEEYQQEQVAARAVVEPGVDNRADGGYPAYLRPTYMP
jgi:hypothetical protein